MKVCPKCQKQYDYDMSFCLEDGSHLETFAETTEKKSPSNVETIELPSKTKPSDIKTEVLLNPEIPPTVLIAPQTIEVKETKRSSLEVPPTVLIQTENLPTNPEKKKVGKMFIIALAAGSLALILIGVIGVVIAFWKPINLTNISNNNAANSNSDTSSDDEYQPFIKLSKEDMETLLKDANPTLLKRLAESPEEKKKQIESIKQLLAVAEEARKSGMTNEVDVKTNLQEIRSQTIATNYDKEKNKGKEQAAPFSLISKAEVDKYYQTATNVEKVDKVLKTKIAENKETGNMPQDKVPTEEVITLFKEQYAKIDIYYKEALDNWDRLSPKFRQETQLNVKLQQAQFLARKYTDEVLSKKVEVKDTDIPAYLAAYPDADPNGEIKKYLDAHPSTTKEQKKAKAEDLLKRAKSGEDFAKLATENTDDPGSKKEGGLYKNVAKGKMMPEFEQAALALEPGKIADNLVETKYGYHIIKLERKGLTKDKDGKEQLTYDARHILISFTDDNPQSPVAAIKQKIEAEQQKKVLDEIVARNPIEVAEDFVVKVPPMPEGQPNGLPPGMKLDPKQQEKQQKSGNSAKQ